MRRSSSAFVLLVGSLVLLVSLYQPWQEASVREQDRNVASLLNLFSQRLTIDGWSSGIGEATALAALLLAAVAILALARPERSDRLPLGLCALVVGYFGLALAVQARSVAHQRDATTGGIEIEFQFAWGAYIGVAAAIAVLLAAGAMPRQELVSARSVVSSAALVLALGLLVAFLLPWARLPINAVRVGSLGIAEPPANVAAVLTLLLTCAWWRGVPDAWSKRVMLPGGVALFTAAAFSSITFLRTHMYGAWIGLALAIALAALPLARGIRVPSLRLPGYALATGGAATLLVFALFLPWQEACYERNGELGLFSGRCLSNNGWTTPPGSVAAILAIALALVVLDPRRLAASTLELGAGLALIVATLGFQLERHSGATTGFRAGLGSGAKVGLVAAAILLALVLVRQGRTKIDWGRAVVRLAPIVACSAYVAVVVLPWWGVLPDGVQSALSFAPLSWLTIAGALVGVRLLRLWVAQVPSVTANAHWLVLLPLALLALATLDLIRLRVEGLTWGRGTIVGLGLVLLLLGWVEKRDGLEELRLPEVLRIDRL